jgi:hypothetical protein
MVTNEGPSDRRPRGPNAGTAPATAAVTIEGTSATEEVMTVSGATSTEAGTSTAGATSTEGALTIEQMARAVGSATWAERRLYEIIGSWVPSTEGAGAKVYFDSCSQHHAWRAQLWEDRLPGRLVQAYATPSAAEWVRPVSPGAEALIKALSGLKGDMGLKGDSGRLGDGGRLGDSGRLGDIGRLAAYCRVVLARTVADYRAWEHRLSPSSDGPVTRALGFALSDAQADWARGTALLIETMDSAHNSVGPQEEGPVGIAAQSSTAVERAIAGRGRLLGA